MHPAPGRALAVIGALLAVGAGGACAAPLCRDGPLEILLANDDGYAAPGIVALRDALRERGHRVTLAAPDYNASGSGASLTMGNVRVTPVEGDDRSFAIAGTPATAVVLAATALYPAGVRPDLVISGINHGENSGSLLAISGTVGAALAGTILLDPPVPGLAVSAKRRFRDEPADSTANVAHVRAVAQHFTGLLDVTRDWYCERGHPVRAGTVLNVNYPALEVAQIRGTVVARQGATTDLRITYARTDDGEYRRTSTLVPVGADDRRSDLARLAEGYVTVTPISAGLNDESAPLRSLTRDLRRVPP